MDALLPLNKLYVQVYCFNPSVTLRSVQSGSHTHKKKRKLVFTLQAVLPQRLLIYWKRYFMLDFLSHIHRGTTAGYKAIRVNSPENVSTPLRTVLLVFVLI